MNNIKLIANALVAAASLAAASAFAVPVSWTDWSAYTVGTPGGGSASGTMSGIAVRYSGEVLSNTQVDGSGADIDYWSPVAPYVGPLIDNAPPNKEIIIHQGQSSPPLTVNTLTFSSPVTKLLFAIVSQGRTNLPVTYDFDSAFTIIDEDAGYWGGGPGAFVLGPGDTVTGYEAHGVLQFTGAITSLSWTASPEEFWHGFTVGVAPIPEPGTWSLMIAGLLLLGFISVRRSRE